MQGDNAAELENSATGTVVESANGRLVLPETLLSNPTKLGQSSHLPLRRALKFFDGVLHINVPKPGSDIRSLLKIDLSADRS